MSSPHRPDSKAQIIPRSPDGRELPQWQLELAEAFTEPRRLLDFLGLDPSAIGYDPTPRSFSMRVPHSFARRMQTGNPRDPLLLQVLPSLREQDSISGFVTDPVGDLSAVTGSGMLQKYQGRALVLTTPACAVHCRYCFRRHFPYTDHSAGSAELLQLAQQLNNDPSITEVILSGGDPLSLGDTRLRECVEALSRARHVQRIRIHTRLPVVLPSRITPALVETLRLSRLPVVMVLHVNHPNELDSDVAAALEPLRELGIHLLNQAVLLRHVNDDADTLAELSEKGFAFGILPYYLHLLDRVAGAAHFDVSEEKARALVNSLRQRLPGYLIPRLVREEAGLPFKRPISS